MKKKLFFFLAVIVILPLGRASAQNKSVDKVLLFSKTTGFRHESIEKGVATLTQLLSENEIEVQHSEKSYLFTTEKLKEFKTIVFLNTTGDILNDAQKLAFQNYIRQGGGFVGIHAASDTEYSWPWYGQLVGGYFKSHPEVQEAKIEVVNQRHAATQHLEKVWLHKDEFYDFKDVQKEQLTLLMLLDETSYKGGQMGKFHPIAWFHEFDGGRSFYTGLGHTLEAYDSVAFQKHMLGGIKWAMKKAK